MFQAFQDNAFQNKPAFQTPGTFWESHGGRIRVRSGGEDRRVKQSPKTDVKVIQNASGGLTIIQGPE